MAAAAGAAAGTVASRGAGRGPGILDRGDPRRRPQPVSHAPGGAEVPAAVGERRRSFRAFARAGGNIDAKTESRKDARAGYEAASLRSSAMSEQPPC